MSIIVMYLKISYLVTEILFVLIRPSAGSTTEQSSHIGITGKHHITTRMKCVGNMIRDRRYRYRGYD